MLNQSWHLPKLFWWQFYWEKGFSKRSEIQGFKYCSSSLLRGLGRHVWGEVALWAGVVSLWVVMATGLMCIPIEKFSPRRRPLFHPSPPKDNFCPKKTTKNDFFTPQKKSFSQTLSADVLLSPHVLFSIHLQRKHCQRHNGPEGWVHITESRWSINFKISNKHKHLDYKI